LGDSSEIHEVLSKSYTQSVSGAQEGVNSFVNNNIDLNVLVHSLVNRIDTLECKLKERNIEYNTGGVQDREISDTRG
jgi:hypothetical protein